MARVMGTMAMGMSIAMALLVSVAVLMNLAVADSPVMVVVVIVGLMAGIPLDIGAMGVIARPKKFMAVEGLGCSH